MSNDTQQPNYNLRSKRVRAGASEGFIRASDLLRRHEERSGDIHQTTEANQEPMPPSQELVPDLSPNRSDEGGSSAPTEGTSQVDATGHQGLDDSSGDAPRQQPPSTPGPVAEQDTEDNRHEVLRLRVQVRDKRNHKITYVWIPINTLI